MHVVEGNDADSHTPAQLRVKGGLQVGRSVGLREVPVLECAERVDVRCRFKAGPVEEVWIARTGLTCPVQWVAQG